MIHLDSASGSVTLELINKTPMVVFYDTHWLTKMVIKNFVKVKFACHKYFL